MASESPARHRRIIDRVQVVVLRLSGRIKGDMLASFVFVVALSEVSGLSVWALGFTPTEINTTLVTLGALVTALGIAAVNIIVAWRTSATVKEVKQDVAAVVTKTAAIAVDTAVVLGHVNSEKTSYEKTIEGLKHEILLKNHMLEDKDRTAQLLAQAAAVATALAQATSTTLVNAGPVATAPVVPLAAPTALPTSVDVSLQKIDENTAATAKNTAKTETDIQILKDKA